MRHASLLRARYYPDGITGRDKKALVAQIDLLVALECVSYRRLSAPGSQHLSEVQIILIVRHTN